MNQFLINLINSNNLYLYYFLVIVVFYIIIGLLTWSYHKPLIFLGVPTTITGVFFLIIRFAPNIILRYVDQELLGMEKIMNSLLNPLLQISIITLVIGIVMIVAYNIIKHKLNTVR